MKENLSQIIVQKYGCDLKLCFKKSQIFGCHLLSQDNLAQNDWHTRMYMQENDYNLRFMKVEVFSSLFTNMSEALKIVPSTWWISDELINGHG